MVNGSQKADKSTKPMVKATSLPTMARLAASTQNNKQHLTLMYLQEPVGLSQIYSDNFQQLCRWNKQVAIPTALICPMAITILYLYQRGLQPG